MLESLPIRKRLWLLMLGASFGALLVAVVAILAYDATTYRPRAVRELQAIAGLYGLTLPAALQFEDPVAAAENLATLRPRSDIKAACVYTRDRVLFAAYRRERLEHCPPTLGAAAGYMFRGRLLLLTAPIGDDEIIGYLALVRELPRLWERLPEYGIMAGVVVLSLLLVSAFLLRGLRSYVTDPLTSLTATAQVIGRTQDYSLRATPKRGDEFGQLTDSFNGMLDTLEQALRLREDFLSIASHELKTPLTPLRLHAQVMQQVLRAPTLGAAERELLVKLSRDAEHQIIRLSALINRLLDVSRITSGQFSLTRESVNLGDQVREVVERHSAELSTARAQLELDLAPRAVGLWDRLRIEQVISNLVMNAAKFGAGKPMRVTVVDRGDWAGLCVRDEGIGIREQDIGRIFNRYARSVDSSSFGGLGLGLFVSQQIVEAHGGRILVRSAPGEGSTFEVWLPKSLPRHTGPHVNAASPAPAGENQADNRGM